MLKHISWFSFNKTHFTRTNKLRNHVHFCNGKKESHTMREGRINRIKHYTKNQQLLQCKQIYPLHILTHLSYVFALSCFLSSDFASHRNFPLLDFLGRFMGNVYFHPIFVAAYILACVQVFFYIFALFQKTINESTMKPTTRNCINKSGNFRTGKMQIETKMWMIVL